MKEIKEWFSSTVGSFINVVNSKTSGSVDDLPMPNVYKKPETEIKTNDSTSRYTMSVEQVSKEEFLDKVRPSKLDEFGKLVKSNKYSVDLITNMLTYGIYAVGRDPKVLATLIDELDRIEDFWVMVDYTPSDGKGNLREQCLRDAECAKKILATPKILEKIGLEYMKFFSSEVWGNKDLKEHAKKLVINELNKIKGDESKLAVDINTILDKIPEGVCGPIELINDQKLQDAFIGCFMEKIRKNSGKEGFDLHDRLLKIPAWFFKSKEFLVKFLERVCALPVVQQLHNDCKEQGKVLRAGDYSQDVGTAVLELLENGRWLGDTSCADAIHTVVKENAVDIAMVLCIAYPQELMEPKALTEIFGNKDFIAQSKKDEKQGMLLTTLKSITYQLMNFKGEGKPFDIQAAWEKNSEAVKRWPIQYRDAYVECLKYIQDYPQLYKFIENMRGWPESMPRSVGSDREHIKKMQREVCCKNPNVLELMADTASPLTVNAIREEIIREEIKNKPQPLQPPTVEIKKEPVPESKKPKL
jgi:hypothetical protein